MLSKTFGSSVYGVEASIITVEVNVTQGKDFYMVGLPDNAVKESQQRVESAIKICEFTFPRQKTIVNLAPADVKKEGAGFDLPIALAILQASEQIFSDHLRDYMVLGDLVTNIPFLRDLLDHPVFRDGHTTTDFIDTHLPAWQPTAMDLPDEVLIAAALADLPDRSTPEANQGKGPKTQAGGDPFTPWQHANGFRIAG